MECQCCVCKSIQRNGVWSAPVSEPLKHVSHTYCPICLKETVRAMRTEISRANKREPVAIS